ncbi:hypothetical protein [Fluviicola chungangensis]|uniref:PD(D/E)XK endonuclease domain-containing protein n=1 Tax=Fluviicola chungangensis TaxID=2597671 RepID=A0A556MYQ7_9FLAO|nr:hypothetical protein [Fluviicola chungangensis]TSJ44983.1 hypothetical protein FO442_10325 [Fluviicola chungangensis]
MKISKPTKKLPQNLKELLKDIGENSVLFQIYVRIHDTPWKAFKNLDDSGCDIVLVNLETNKTIKVEVKTRQSLYTTATSTKTEGSREFEVTKNEYENFDILICLWYDYNSFFILPKSELKGENKSIKIRIRKSKSGGYGDKDRFLNNWQALLDLL